MGLFDKLFGNKGEDEQKKQQQEARERGNALLKGVNAAMSKALAVGARTDSRISGDELFLYREQMAALQAYLKSLPALRLDTAEIDKALSLIAEKVEEAVEEDMPRTTEQGVKALQRGILVGRADIAESETAAMLDIVDERMKLLNALSTAVAAAMNIDTATRNLARFRKELETNQAKLAALDDELEQHPEMVDVVRLLREPANEEEIELLRRQMARSGIVGLINGNEQSITLQENTIDTADIQIQQAEVAYLTLNSKIKVDTTQKMEQMLKDVQKSIAENEETLININEVTEKLTALFASWKEPEFIRLKKVSAKLSYEESEAKKRRIERDRAAAEKQRLWEEQERLRKEQEQKLKELERQGNGPIPNGRQTIVN